MVAILIADRWWGVMSSTNPRSVSFEHQQQQFFKQSTVSLGTFLGTSYFWNKTLQNWQSEFFAIGVFAVATIYLRQRGSTESKPVGAPHDATGA